MQPAATLYRAATGEVVTFLPNRTCPMNSATMLKSDPPWVPLSGGR